MEVLGAFNVAELALFNNEMLAASLGRVGDMENPTFDFKYSFFFYASK